MAPFREDSRSTVAVITAEEGEVYAFGLCVDQLLSLNLITSQLD